MTSGVHNTEDAHFHDQAVRPTTIPALAGIGAGAIHAAAIGVHADHRVVANIFVLLAVLQLASGLALLVRPGRSVTKVVFTINVGAVVGWLVTRSVGVWFVAGLEVAEHPDFADTVCALLGALAAAGAVIVVRAESRLGSPQTWLPATDVRDLVLPSIVVILLAVPAMSLAATHEHRHTADVKAHGLADQVWSVINSAGNGDDENGDD